MSIKVELDKLAEEMSARTIGYLVTVGEDGPAHLGEADFRWVGDKLVAGAGRTTRRHVTAGRPVSMMWPPTDPDGYTLIADGTGEIVGEDDEAVVHITPTWAVLHRRARPDSPPGLTGCGDDCAPLAGDES